MDSRRALLIDAFSRDPLAGNPAGLLPDAEGLADAQMQGIARELGASETAFLGPSASADRRLRYFTPSTEIDLCGHATVAAHAHLLDESVIDAGTHSLETNVGVLDIEVECSGRVWMTQDEPEIREADLDLEHVTETLGVDPAALDVDGLPVAFASTGLPFLIVPVRLLSDLGAAEPNMPAVERLAEAVGAVGVYAFTFDTLAAESALHGRAWAPTAGVPEDPVTGTASGAVGAYLEEFDAFDAVPDELTFEQGHFVDRPGRVFVRVGEEVRVGGYATSVFDGEMIVPPLEVDDGILQA